MEIIGNKNISLICVLPYCCNFKLVSKMAAISWNTRLF